MNQPAFIGPELEAAGYRLAGVQVMVPDGRDVVELVDRARRTASLVLVSASVARALPQEVLEEMVFEAQPPVAIMPDIVGEGATPDMERAVHAALGIL